MTSTPIPDAGERIEGQLTPAGMRRLADRLRSTKSVHEFHAAIEEAAAVLDSLGGAETVPAGKSKLADDLESLCCAETEGKFFDCVTDNIQTIIAALRNTRAPSAAAAPVEVLRELLDCANGIVGARTDDPDAAEAFQMFDNARVKARAALSAPPEQGEAVAMYQARFRDQESALQKGWFEIGESAFNANLAKVEYRRLYTHAAPKPPAVTAEEIKNALVEHFKAVISASAGKPFEETDVHLPEKSFDGYAAAILHLLSGGRSEQEISQMEKSR